MSLGTFKHLYLLAGTGGDRYCGYRMKMKVRKKNFRRVVVG